MKISLLPISAAALISGVLAVQSPTLGRTLLAVDPMSDILRATATPPSLITVTPSPTDDMTRITMTPVPTTKPILTPIWPILTPHITPVVFIYVPATMQNKTH
jgi:hypothetical protein